MAQIDIEGGTLEMTGTINQPIITPAIANDDYASHFQELYNETLRVLQMANAKVEESPVVAGYPSQWISVSKSLLGNLIKIKKELAQQETRVDKSELEDE